MNDSYGGNEERCCGCGGCAAECSTGAIQMHKDARGFPFPLIDQSCCNDCGRCTKVCAFKQGTKCGAPPETAYAMRHKDSATRMASRSGGVFTALSDLILDVGGVVYGCTLDATFRARHSRADDRAGRNAFRGSKYVQSDIGSCFAWVMEDLRAGRQVLFSGTPCQVAQMRRCAGSAPGLLLVDVICHGVASPAVWHAYLRDCEARYGGPVIAADFRNKRIFGWQPHYETVVINGKVHADDRYKKLYLGHWPLRESCFRCPYKSLNRISDITIGDFWGVEQAAPAMNDGKGTSIVLPCTHRGLQVIEELLALTVVDFLPVRVADALQPSLQKNFVPPTGQAAFWRDFIQYGFGYVAKTYASDSLFRALRKKQYIYRKLILAKRSVGTRDITKTESL